LVEAILALMVLPVAVWVWRLKPLQPEEPLTASISTSKEIGAFNASLRKEILFQWRSRRLLIVLAVYLAFGMLSPLLAKFTPELLGSLEGAEQFAELIPEPTIQDALGQYIRNLNQFGFILVILLGMGAIAGEKERGTSVMILSKPLPRWAFVTSKFIAQLMVFASAFVLAAIASYFYTVSLFGPLKISDLALVNLLLFTWLSVFVAITLFGSALGKTTAAAAGIALLVSVIFLIIGTIPKYGALAPGGLTIWANQIAIGEVITPNAGALALSLVLVILAVLAAIAVFERQDI
jgi:ABC-2 type transport system permease protein